MRVCGWAVCEGVCGLFVKVCVGGLFVKVCVWDTGALFGWDSEGHEWCYICVHLF